MDDANWLETSLPNEVDFNFAKTLKTLGDSDDWTFNCPWELRWTCSQNFAMLLASSCCLLNRFGVFLRAVFLPFEGVWLDEVASVSVEVTSPAVSEGLVTSLALWERFDGRPTLLFGCTTINADGCSAALLLAPIRLERRCSPVAYTMDSDDDVSPPSMSASFEIRERGERGGVDSAYPSSPRKRECSSSLFFTGQAQSREGKE